MIDNILEEWKADFDNEEIKRKEMKFYLKHVNGGLDSNKGFESVVMNVSKPLSMKMHTVKSEIMNNRPVDGQDDAIFNLESQLDEKDEKIREC